MNPKFVLHSPYSTHTSLSTTLSYSHIASHSYLLMQDSSPTNSYNNTPSYHNFFHSINPFVMHSSLSTHHIYMYIFLNAILLSPVYTLFHSNVTRKRGSVMYLHSYTHPWYIPLIHLPLFILPLFMLNLRWTYHYLTPNTNSWTASLLVFCLRTMVLTCLSPL